MKTAHRYVVVVMMTTMMMVIINEGDVDDTDYSMSVDNFSVHDDDVCMNGSIIGIMWTGDRSVRPPGHQH